MKRQAADIARDLGEQMSAAEVADLLARLESYPAPPLDPGATDALIARLRPLLPVAKPARFRAVALEERPLLGFLRSLLTFGRLLHPLWWLLSLALVLGGAALAPLMADLNLPVSVLAPVLAVGSLAYGYRNLTGGALEVELSCPLSKAQLILGRALVMLSYYLVLGGLLALLLPHGLLAVLLPWCAALVLFTGLMLALTVHLGTQAAVAGALLAWGALLLLAERGHGLFTWPGAAGWLWLQLGALALGLVLMALAALGSGYQRWLGRGHA